MDQDIAYDYEKLCEHFGIDHSKNDADKRLLSALRAGNKTKKKAGRKREWTGNRQFDFFLGLCPSRNTVQEEASSPTKKEGAG
jgi:hypothetical protein